MLPEQILEEEAAFGVTKQNDAATVVVVREIVVPGGEHVASLEVIAPSRYAVRTGPTGDLVVHRGDDAADLLELTGLHQGDHLQLLRDS